jgi:hypothetical protein
MPIVVAFLYLLSCIICGLMGRATAFGFLGHFLLSLVITPIGDALVQIAGRPSYEIRKLIEKVTEK